ncbi:hypothetical protein [Flavobacterium luteum]|uniref:Lipoprotein n=1 Tax=Flavobacterium luteum TaxID=2026654 RepID=A0A7J5AC33_9FLAO|nr:hypothetical protein [Flavobacterium luteum]KAB1155090.1 hypothetical protein F6464_11775 [Flavobacterium luteum]
MKIFQFIIITLLSLFVFSCQDEDENEIRVPNTSLTKVDPLTSLLSRVSQYPTAIDNILDGNSYCSVQLPVTVVVNYNKIEVSSQEDYKLVASIIDEYSNDDDKINFVFPITMVFRNFSKLTINNQLELKNLLDSYNEYTDYTEIDCVDFSFPIGINSYDSNSQQAKSFIIQNNSQLYNFVYNLKETDFFTLDFPITITSKIDGKIVEVQTNNELKSSIENEIGKCEIPSNENKDLSSIIVTGTWYVSYFLDNYENETAEYMGYNFTFLSNGSVTVVKNSSSIDGTWSSYTDGGIKKFVMSFSGINLDELEEDWKIIEYNGTNIRLKHENSESHYLYLTKK